MRIRFGEGPFVDDLIEFLRRSECVAERVGKHGIEVNPQLTLPPEAARLEIEGLLRVWCRLHPEASLDVTLIEPASLHSRSDRLDP